MDAAGDREDGRFAREEEESYQHRCVDEGDKEDIERWLEKFGASGVGNKEEGEREGDGEGREKDIGVVGLGVPAEEFLSVEEAEVED